MDNLAMDEGKPWWTVELLLSDLRIPYSLLDSLVKSLLSPSSRSRSQPPHLRRLLLLHHLLSLSASHPLETLKTLDLLLPQPPSPPPLSICKAYASILFYISLYPAVSASDSVRSIDQIREYEFSAEILRPLDGMMKEFVDCEDDCVAVAKEKAICAVKVFVEEELRIVGPPFFLRAAETFLKAEQNTNRSEAGASLRDQNTNESEAEASLREQNSNRSEAEAFLREQNENISEDETVLREQNTNTSEAACASSVREDLEENQDTSEERVKYRMAVRKKKISQVNSEENLDNPSKEKDKHQMVLRKRKISELNLEENRDISGERNKSNGQSGTEKDGIGTDCTGTEPINLSKTNELNPNPNLDRTEMRDREINKGKNINNPSTPHAKDANVKKKRRLMDRNPTARKPKRRACKPKRRASKRASEPIKKKRPKRKWSEEEVKALIKGVNEIGEGKWKQILEEYGDEFDDRTDVDLKDKWRNLGPYLLEVGGKWSV